MATRKAVRTISVTGIGSGMGLVNAFPDGIYQTEVDAISAYGDPYVTNVPRTEGKTFGELTFEFLDEGNDAPESLNGTVQTITITATYGDGKGADTTKTKTFDFAITNVGSGAVQHNGERRATITITGVQHHKDEASPSNG